jgi:hypothetical protein
VDVPAPGLPAQPVALPLVGATIARDADGNAIGGLRLPFMEVPVASYNGNLCDLFGTTTTFTPLRLDQLYPSHSSYLAQMLIATDRAVSNRYLICADAVMLMRHASASSIGGTDSAGASTPACAR